MTDRSHDHHEAGACTEPWAKLQGWPSSGSVIRIARMECVGTTTLWLHRSKTHSEGFFNRARSLHREAKAETCLRTPKPSIPIPQRGFNRLSLEHVSSFVCSTNAICCGYVLCRATGSGG